jgi:hypothetical protein
VVAGALFDAKGNPFDVTNCQPSWALLDPEGNPLPATAAISKIARSTAAFRSTSPRSTPGSELRAYSEILANNCAPSSHSSSDGHACVFGRAKQR